MHLTYLCTVIRLLRSYKQVISSLWIGIMFLSISLIVLHRHDHSHENQDSCELNHKHQHDHSHAEDCHYCFLFFQQGIQVETPFHWESNPKGFLLNTIQSIQVFEAPILEPKSSKSLRAPPHAYFTTNV